MSSQYKKKEYNTLSVHTYVIYFYHYLLKESLVCYDCLNCWGVQISMPRQFSIDTIVKYLNVDIERLELVLSPVVKLSTGSLK